MDRTSVEQLEAIKQFLRQSGNYASKPVEQIRREMDEAAARMPQHTDVTIQPVTIGHIDGEWVIPTDPLAELPSDQQPEQLRPHNHRTILYFHGGGFIAGSSAFYRDLGARIAKASGASVLIVNYRLAPEFPYPAANDDCLYAYRWLCENGYTPSQIVLGGDSVGGSLVLMALLSLRDQGEKLPAGAFLLSPHTDLVHLDGESYTSRAALDPTGSWEGNQRILDDYLGGQSPHIPLLSPLRLNLHGLPNLFLQVGDHEVLLSDSLRLAERAKLAGVPVELEVWENMWSVFQALAYLLPEAQQAIARIGEFVKGRLEGNRRC
ncbi:alpha/beta hydrolase [Paenibacillus sp. MMS18-CY102]|uniref:alpha/beta hydrolase n=1 Tax=Paenibacillus sp. MMS18-CY102 TaxID=2682849 RepID=UPI001365C1D0|nr:alpha/beta hydrolase [Paenibacillus sp. MMS18-CY102]MWC31232.1 alpha/beta hydrolase fold domain-containing protein [Paenibacillus sp. MMS18-CY102]